MQDTELIIKLLEQTSENIENKIDNVIVKIEELDREQRSSTDEHKIHEKVAYETRVLIENHLRSDDTYQRNVDSTLKDINNRLIEYNSQLAIHIAGVISIREQNELIRTEIEQRDVLINTRLTEVEKPLKWLENTGLTIKWIGLIATAFGTLIGFLKYLKKI